MKKTILSITAVFAAIIGITVPGCKSEPAEIRVSSVSVSPSSLTLTEGETGRFTATVSPADADDKTVTWKSSAPDIVSVGGDGSVTALKPGEATVTVTTKDGGKTANAKVTVRSKTIAVTGVSLDKTSLTLTEGTSETLTATVKPEDATDKSVKWSSDKPEIASVDNAGKVSALKEGKAVVTVTTVDGGKTASCEVTVSKKTIAVTGVRLDKESVTIEVKQSVTLSATVSPADATDKSVKWSSDKPEIASVDDAGKVSALKEGKAVVTVTTVDGGKTASCEVTVEPVKVTAVTVSPDKVTIQENKSFKLSAVCTPDEAPDKAVIWKSMDTGVATVAEDGTVTGIRQGTTQVLAMLKSNNSVFGRCDVTVTEGDKLLTAISFDKTAITTIVGAAETITVTFTPSDAKDKSLVWASNNPSVATVTANSTYATVKAVSVGTATITAISNDGGHTATCAVTVKNNDEDLYHAAYGVIFLNNTEISYGNKVCIDGKDVYWQARESDAPIETAVPYRNGTKWSDVNVYGSGSLTVISDKVRNGTGYYTSSDENVVILTKVYADGSYAHFYQTETAEKIHDPSDIVVSSKGDAYLCGEIKVGFGEYAYKVWKFAADGTGSSYSLDNKPLRMAIDTDDNVYTSTTYGIYKGTELFSKFDSFIPNVPMTWKNGHLYYAYGNGNRLEVYKDSALLYSIECSTKEDARPCQIAVSAAGNVYMSMISNKMIYKNDQVLFEAADTGIRYLAVMD